MVETLWYLGGIVFVAIGIAISIGLHEIGHLWPAKKFGVKVPNYAIGFGPTLYKFTRGETTYSLKLIPLGGYITMIGMYPPEKAKVGSKSKASRSMNEELDGKPKKTSFFADMILSAREAHSEHVTPADKNRMFYQLPVWKRMIVMLGGPVMNLLLGTVIMVAVLVGFGTNQQSNRIAEVSPCVVTDVSTQRQCVESDPQSPAVTAGLRANDRIQAIDGVAFENWNSLSQLLSVGSTSNLSVLRAEELIDIQVTPVAALRAKTDENGQLVLDANRQPVMVERPVLGIIFDVERKPDTVVGALQKSAESVGLVGQMIMTLPQQLTDVVVATVTSQPRNPNGAVSIVGIAQISGTVAATDEVDAADKIATGLLIIGSLNFALFAFNMLPLLPLDGGHIAGGIYETGKRAIFKLRRKPDPGPADTALLMPITWFVFIALMAMSALLIIADLVNPISI
jgi:membrane-associated protease RseP (regulator of RpoE activity)